LEESADILREKNDLTIEMDRLDRRWSILYHANFFGGTDMQVQQRNDVLVGNTAG
jgi:hypothetical protein